jgi:hypothetical protein
LALDDLTTTTTILFVSINNPVVKRSIKHCNAVGRTVSSQIPERCLPSNRSGGNLAKCRHHWTSSPFALLWTSWKWKGNIINYNIIGGIFACHDGQLSHTCILVLTFYPLFLDLSSLGTVSTIVASLAMAASGLGIECLGRAWNFRGAGQNQALCHFVRWSRSRSQKVFLHQGGRY